VTQHRYVKVSELVARLHLAPDDLRRLEAEGLVEVKYSSEGEPVLSAADVERVRLAQLLTTELDVNLAGVEVIVHMRESMLAMQRQFADILDAVVDELRRQAKR
jgi:MerR family transcriptional regulator/heat shock protein HspR